MFNIKFYGLAMVIAGFSTHAFGASSVTCKITGADAAPFKSFVGGSISIDLKTGNNRLRTIDENKNTLQYSSISDKLVSSFAVDRKTCKTTVATEPGQNGQLKSFRFTFENCEFRAPEIPNYVGYVSVIQSFNFNSNRGTYQELFVDGGKTRRHTSSSMTV